MGLRGRLRRGMQGARGRAGTPPAGAPPGATGSHTLCAPAAAAALLQTDVHSAAGSGREGCMAAWGGVAAQRRAGSARGSDM